MAGIDAYTTLCIQSETTNGATTFVDNSPVGRSITRSGTTHSTAQAVFGSSSIYFNGSSYLSAAGGSWAFGSANFTIDLRVRLSSVTSFQCLFREEYVNLYLNNSGKVVFTEEYTYWTITGATTLSQNTWYHIAVVRNGSIFTLYINGVSDGSMTHAGSLGTPSSAYAAIGVDAGSRFVTGYMEELRVDKGVARWTANFTPPSEPYDNNVSMVVTGEGGAVAGGTGVIGLYEHVSSGGAVAGGSSPNIGILVSPPTQHWTFNDITDGIATNEVVGGETLLCAGRTQVGSKDGFGYAASGGTPTQPLELDNEISFKSISMWIKRYDMTEDVYLLYNSVNPRWLRIQVASGDLQFYDGVEILTSNLTISDTNWHHLCIVESSPGYHRFHLDSVKASSDLLTNFSTIQFFSLYASSPGYRDPLVDNIQVYRRSITDDDVDYLFNASSDYTSLPRLPSLVGSVDGGAVVGGSATVELRNTGMEFMASGGAVAGGTGMEPWAEIAGAFPDTYGDIQAQVTTTADVSGSFPDTYGEITQPWIVEGIFPDTFGDIRTMHTVNVEVDGQFPDTYGNVQTVTTMLAAVAGVFPDTYGDIQTQHSEQVTIEGVFPDTYGDIDCATTRYVSIDGAFPDTFGVIIVDAGADDDDLLWFIPHVLDTPGVAGPDIDDLLSFIAHTPEVPGLPGTAIDEVLEFYRPVATRFVSVAGIFPDTFGAIAVDAGGL